MKQLAKKKKSNPLPKSYRGKKRYVALLLHSNELFSQRDVVSAVLAKQRELFGSVGLSKQKIGVVRFDPKLGIAIIKSELSELQNVKAGLLLLTHIGSKPVVPEIKKVSGSLKALSKN
ncbi:MAG: hypothetical protein J4215_04560 [Candidatus Diapherotrites archaeon]|uniref:Uncharacterized protein n=1 Tax=Candidatus Iainarchaeum sp. TaxID=3101447 RepID=A0A8T4LG13_9ARCH|nr:hypothetical protein [Candidatus Diapherotrites archaeon]